MQNWKTSSIRERERQCVPGIPRKGSRKGSGNPKQSQGQELPVQTIK